MFRLKRHYWSPDVVETVHTGMNTSPTVWQVGTNTPCWIEYRRTKTITTQTLHKSRVPATREPPRAKMFEDRFEAHAIAQNLFQSLSPRLLECEVLTVVHQHLIARGQPRQRMPMDSGTKDSATALTRHADSQRDGRGEAGVSRSAV